MNIILGLIITIGCVLGGFIYMGCDIQVLLEPAEYIILLGAALGTLIISNSFYVLADSLKAVFQALFNLSPKKKDYLQILGLLYNLMRDMKTKTLKQIEAEIEQPEESELFSRYPEILADKTLLDFICDYCRLIMMGNARSFEVEALMDEEIDTLINGWLKPSRAFHHLADALPALGIVAAVLGIIRALGNIDAKPEVLGHFVGTALIGTFGGVFFAYAVFNPLSEQMHQVRLRRVRPYIVVKQTLLAFMNGAYPNVAIEYGRKTIPELYRPTLDQVETEAIYNFRLAPQNK